MNVPFLPMTVVDAPVVRLSGGGPLASSSAGWLDALQPGDFGLFAFGIIAFAGLALVLFSMLARWWYGLSPAERAAWWLSRRAGLSRSERRLLRTLASARPGVEIVALLLSPRAFARCAAVERHPPARAAEVERLRVRLHGH